MSKQRRLGRGLEALLGRPLDTPAGDEQPDTDSASASAGPAITMVSVYEIDRNPFQPRVTFDDAELQALAESLGQHGMLQPIVVRRIAGRFQLISGERRWRAATIAGWEKVPTQVLDVDDRQMAELAIVENVQRKDLNPLEKAVSFQRYLDQYQCTQEELAGRVQIDRSTISNLIRLLELPETVQQALRDGAITQGHARALLPLGDEREQIAFCRRIQQEQLSVRAVEEWVKQHIAQDEAERSILLGPGGAAGGAVPAPRAPRSEHLASLEQELRSALGTKVDLKQSGRGRGKIVIHFTSHNEFDRLKAHLVGSPPQRLQDTG